MSRLKPILFFICILVTCIQAVQAKTEKFGTWIELEFEKEFLKRFAFSIAPEFRFQDQFHLDEYMIQGNLSYEPFSFLTLAGSYRLGTEVKRKDNTNYSRIAFDVQASHEINRLEASLRMRYTNSNDSEEDEPGNYIRPRLKLEYDIKGNKITPFAAYEFFHNITEKEWHKSRIDVGFTRDIAELHRIGMYYRLNNYFTEKESIHILGLEYRLKF